ncbi:MAG TPA: DoxX family membrane protein [Thermoanaerobaculia bacterium]
MACLTNLAAILTRIFLGLIFFTSGMGKLTHGDFPGLIGPVWLEQRLAEYGLGMWAVFVAWSQVTVGLLLLSQRFATLGAVMLVPMLANILVITISMEWRGMPYVNAVLLAMNLFLLFVDRHRLKLLLIDDDSPRTIALTRRRPTLDLLCLAAIAVCFAAAALHDVTRLLTFALAAAGVAMFAVSAVRERWT